MKPLVLIGGGGHCLSVIDAAESAGMQIAGILDRADCGFDEVGGYPVLGTDDEIERLASDFSFVVTVGFIKNPAIRRKLWQRIIAAGGEAATVIASTARVSPRAEIGAGTVVLHHACVNAGAEIGENCIVNTAANIEHGVIVGDGTHISTGAMVNGDCAIGNEVFVGSNATINQCVTLADGVIVASGSVVRRDALAPGIIR